MFTAKKLKLLYGLWLLLMLLLTAYMMLTGWYQEIMGASVDSLPKNDQNLSRDIMILSFSIISILFFLAQVLVGWVLLVFALRAKRWAMVLFVIFSALMVFYMAYMTVTLPATYPEHFNGTIDQLINWGTFILNFGFFAILGYGVVKVKTNQEKESAI